MKGSLHSDDDGGIPACRRLDCVPAACLHQSDGRVGVDAGRAERRTAAERAKSELAERLGADRIEVERHGLLRDVDLVQSIDSALSPLPRPQFNVFQ